MHKHTQILIGGAALFLAILAGSHDWPSLSLLLSLGAVALIAED